MALLSTSRVSKTVGTQRRQFDSRMNFSDLWSHERLAHEILPPWRKIYLDTLAKSATVWGDMSQLEFRFPLLKMTL